MDQETRMMPTEITTMRHLSSTWNGRIKGLLLDAASAWRISLRMILVIWAVPVAVALAGVVAALISKDLYKLLSDEDRVAENLQVLFYAFALVLCVIITRRLWKAGRKGIALLYLAVSLGLVFLIGEELSWGQRIFGWVTPATFQAVNKQEETNIHNIRGVGAAFKWIQLLVGAYGAILPLVVLKSTRLARYRDLLSWVVPHYTLLPYFLPMFVWKVFRNLTEVPDRFYFVVEQYNEIIELILAIGMLLFMVYQWRAISEQDQTGALRMSKR
ncbi:MAG: hypothetical protein HZB51_13700 [Chloroflexi bacterium]|nr:hypothetical protein [Chloroflexota bacterium]